MPSLWLFGQYSQPCTDLHGSLCPRGQAVGLVLAGVRTIVKIDSHPDLTTIFRMTVKCVRGGGLLLDLEGHEHELDF